MFLKVILSFSNKQKCSVILANSSNIYLLREMKRSIDWFEIVRDRNIPLHWREWQDLPG